MKVLILYPTDNQISLIKGVVDGLYERGIFVLALNVNTWTYYCGRNGEIFEGPIKLITKWKYFMSKSILRIVFFHLSILTPIPFFRLFESFDIVDYNYHLRHFDALIRYASRKNVRQIVSIWGSDFYRELDSVKRKRRNIYKLVDAIHVETIGVKNDFLDYYNEFQDKIKVCNYGISLFDTIKKYENINKEVLKKKFIPNYNGNKIVITCGYNARRGQQHMKIIDAVESLPQRYKEKIHLIFPMTYSSEDSVSPEVVDKLNSIKISSHCFTEKLNYEDLALLRLTSDVVINIQITDAFASSLMEYFYASNIMLLGDWLPYSFLRNLYGWFFLGTSENHIADKLVDIIDNYNSYSQAAINNKEKVYEFCSWEGCSLRLESIYRNAML